MTMMGQDCKISHFVLAATGVRIDRDRIEEQVLLWRLQEESHHRPIDFCLKFFIVRLLQLGHKSEAKESYQK